MKVSLLYLYSKITLVRLNLFQLKNILPTQSHRHITASFLCLFSFFSFFFFTKRIKNTLCFFLCNSKPDKKYTKLMPNRQRVHNKIKKCDPIAFLYDNNKNFKIPFSVGSNYASPSLDQNRSKKGFPPNLLRCSLSNMNL